MYTRGKEPDKIHKEFNVNYRRWPRLEIRFFYILGEHAIFSKLSENFLPRYILVSRLRFQKRAAPCRVRYIRFRRVDGNRLRRPGVPQKLPKSRGNEGRQVKERGQ